MADDVHKEGVRKDKAKQWRARADHYRALALKARSRENRDTYHDLARNCDEVAEPLEKPNEPV